MKRRRMPVRKVVRTPRPEERQHSRDHEKTRGPKGQSLPVRRVCAVCKGGFDEFLDETLCMRCRDQADKLQEAARSIAAASNHVGQ